MRPLDEADVEERAAEMTARFDRFGEVLLRRRREDNRRGFYWTIWAPHESAPLGQFQYEEVFVLESGAWRMADYAYDFLDLAHDGRRGYHWHVIPGRGASPEYHAHCSVPISPKTPYYRHIPLTLEEAHRDFVRLYFGDLGITCTDLLPLI